ncbi:MAG: DUF2062 domain-containing protein [Pirellulaceae bacterium]
MYRRHVQARFRLYIRRARAFVYHNVLHADDPPHQLALGAAIGIFILFTPTVGFQMMISLLLAWLLKANKAIGVAVVWISNPATMIPIFYPCYLVGRTMLFWEPVSNGWWRQLAQPPPGWWPAVIFYWSRLLEIALPLWLGGIVIGLLVAYPTYYALYYAICSYRMRRWGQLVPPSLSSHTQPAASRRVETGGPSCRANAPAASAFHEEVGRPPQ